ncbi:hypothetical protein [Flagellimonas eckloniae]|uniref:Uncharacterized protein n=1 Tax=Flagellimonas eckloniae TaxID=346185 RepID=A0A0Q0XKY1_9FLAO|nr:hypothetical protein [Allomuricauda eckloniae]KQC31558.1 hypothetical protein AAY42_01550 [Allomuricauda eckloniae]
MKLKQSLLIAILLSIISLAAWEIHWRSKPDYYRANLEDDRYLWAQHKAKVASATENDVVIIGSSRTGFDFNTHVWEEVQGSKPINLSTNGKPPLPFLEDIVENTDFNGTLILGVTPLLCFSPGVEQRNLEAKMWVEHYHNQTYAQKLGFWVSKPLERNLVMLTSSELKFYNDLDLKALINTISIGERIPPAPKFLNFGYNDEDRNLIMFSSMVTKPEFAEKVQNVWNSFLPYIPDYEVIKDVVPTIIEKYQEPAKKFKARGGKIILVRHKAENEWNMHTKRILPKNKVWDKFVELLDCPAYHFEDYGFMSKHTLPDWSHMNAEDAKTYTADLVNQLIKDKHLQKTN